MPSGLGATNVVVEDAPGCSAAMLAAAGKHDCDGHPAMSWGMHSTTKSCGVVPLFVSVRVTLPRFCTLRMTGENPVSVTVTSSAKLPPLIPSLSPGAHGSPPLLALLQSAK